MNPSVYWSNISSENLEPKQLCERIVDVLSTHCFNVKSDIVEALRRAMSQIYDRLTHSAPSTRSVIFAMEAARNVGLFESQTGVTAKPATSAKGSAKDKTESDDKYFFEAAIIMLLYLRKDIVNLNYPYRSLEELLGEYPDFASEGEDEQLKLLNFANCMKVALQLIKAKLHKQELLLLCTRLSEGKSVKYVTGSGQKPETRRRVAIYEHEGGVKAESRPWRVNWKLVTDILQDDTEGVATVDMSQYIMDNVTVDPAIKAADFAQETIRFRHPSIANVHVDATEYRTPTGGTLMRALSYSRVTEDEHGVVFQATELKREFSIAGEIFDGDDDFSWMNHLDENLDVAENNLSSEISVSRQSKRVDGQFVKSISVSKQFNNPDGTPLEDGDLFTEEVIFSDLVRQNSLSRQGSVGKVGYLRSLSTGSVASDCDLFRNGTSNSETTGLRRMNSNGNQLQFRQSSGPARISSASTLIGPPVPLSTAPSLSFESASSAVDSLFEEDHCASPARPAPAAKRVRHEEP